MIEAVIAGVAEQLFRWFVALVVVGAIVGGVVVYFVMR
jgi:hypothetical protein